MDPQQPTTPGQPTAPVPPPPVPPPPSNASKKIILIIVFAGIVAAILAVIGYFSFINNPDEDIVPPSAQTTPAATPTPPVTSPTPTADHSEIQALFEAKDYNALREHFGNTVMVFLYASECCGPQTIEQTITQLQYLDSAQGPWNWDQQDATIMQIKESQPNTFGAGTIGISSNGYALSYVLVGNKIAAIYMSGSYELLLP